MNKLISTLGLLLLPGLAIASPGSQTLDLTTHTVGYAALFIFVIAYLLVMAEEFTHLRKSKPVMLAAGIIWAMIGYVYVNNGMTHEAEAAVRHNLLEYAELMLFLLVAMTYINAMAERNVFDALRAWMINKGFSFRQLFWITGILAFFISPIADNLTTALLMAAVVMAVGGDNSRFVVLAMINIVVAANAGGACVMAGRPGPAWARRAAELPRLRLSEVDSAEDEFRGKCRWCIQPIWRYHYINGLAERYY